MLPMKESLSGMNFAPLFMDTAHLRPEGHRILTRAIAEKIAGAEYAAALVEGNPGAIVRGMPIPYCPRPVLDYRKV